MKGSHIERGGVKLREEPLRIWTHNKESYVSIVVSGILCHFKLTFPSLFLLKDKVKAAHYNFNCCPHGSGLHPENPPD